MIIGLDSVGSPEEIHSVEIVSGRSATIPCKATNPAFHIVLLDGNFMEQQVDGVNLLYDPKAGFHVIRGTSKYNGAFFCQASVDSQSQPSEPHFMWLNFGSRTFSND